MARKAMRSLPKNRKPIWKALPVDAKKLVAIVGDQFQRRKLDYYNLKANILVTRPINFDCPADVTYWLQCAHVLMGWARYKGKDWDVLFGALEEWGLHLTEKQKRELIEDFESD